MRCALFLLLAGCAGPEPAAPPERIWGVTVDRIDHVRAVVESLRKLPARPMTRVVFDESVPPREYRDAVAEIHAVSAVMGELLDSSAMKEMSLEKHRRRTSQYLSTLGDGVDVWEIGNEVNGDWLGPTGGVVAKISDAYDQVKTLGKKAALTLYYNAGCVADPAFEMFTWAGKHLPDRMKQGLDYVFVSYYEDDCNDLQPDWPAVIRRLGEMFPHSKLGIGECGTKKADRKEAYLRRYYGMAIDHPRFVGGYFWWYFCDDMVPSSKPLWPVLRDLIAR